MLPYDLKNFTTRITFGNILTRMVDTIHFLLTALLLTIIIAVLYFSFILAATVPVSEPFQRVSTMEVQK